MTQAKTFWYIYYILNGNVEMDTQQKERSLRGFRLPCKQFCQLLNLLEKDERF